MPEVELSNLSNRLREGLTMATTKRRRSGRILAVVPIQVIGQAASGRTFIEETVTICFNQQGARISLLHSLIPDEIVVIRNLQNDIEEEFRVVGGFDQVIGRRREWGVEACNPHTGIWGMEFGPRDDEDQMKALIECGACKRAALTPLSLIEYDVLLATAMISRHCDRCGETTRWKPSEQCLPSETGTESSQSHSTRSETRNAERRSVSLQIQVRDQQGTSCAAKTRDVSKTGICFATTQHFRVGDELWITFPFAKKTPIEKKVKVVWTAIGANQRIYGARFIQK